MGLIFILYLKLSFFYNFMLSDLSFAVLTFSGDDRRGVEC